VVIRTAAFKQEYLDQANAIIRENEQHTPNDGYPYISGEYIGLEKQWGPMGPLVSMGILECLNIWGGEYNTVWFESWVNVVRPVRRQSGVRHNHVEINRYLNKPVPNYTWVYYMQMPDKVSGKDGMLEVEHDNGETKYYLPNVGDMYIFGGDLYHSIYDAPQSTVNRVVLAGNVAIQNNKTKHSLM